MADNDDRKDLDDDQPEVEGGATPAQQNEDEVERQRKLEDEKRQRAEAVRKRREDQQKKTNVLKSKDEPIKPTATPAPAKKPIREDVVNSCVNFLNHPKVKGSPQSQKVLFLQKKGLTQDEIDEAIRRANAASSTTPATVASPAPTQSTQPTYAAPAQTYQAPPPGYPAAPYPYYPPPQQQQQQLIPASQSWTNTKLGFLVTAAACMSVGAGIAYLARKYIFSDKEAELKAKAEQAAKEEERRKKEEEDRKANMKILEEMVSTLKSIQAQNSEMSELVKTYQTQVNEWRDTSKKPTTTAPSVPGMDNYSKMMMSEMQSQLNSLKAQVIDMKSNQQTKPAWSPATTRPAIPSWQQADTTAAPATTTTTTTTAAAAPKVEEKPEAAPYPKDFQSIMQMVQNGQTPPGIREINDKPLDPNAKVEKGAREPPTKPWTRVPEETPVTTTTTTTTTSAEEVADKQ